MKNLKSRSWNTEAAATERILEAPGGCVIVLDAKTGAVLANANYPDFDPADFVTQDVNPDAAARVSAMLQDVESRPLLNRGIAETYTPGSTLQADHGDRGFGSRRDFTV